MHTMQQSVSVATVMQIVLMLHASLIEPSQRTKKIIATFARRTALERKTTNHYKNNTIPICKLKIEDPWLKWGQCEDNHFDFAEKYLRANSSNVTWTEEAPISGDALLSLPDRKKV